jgi:hypothetical protein
MDAYFRGYVQALSDDEDLSAEAPEAAEPSPPPGRPRPRRAPVRRGRPAAT